jgi:hypothetical protein
MLGVALEDETTKESTWYAIGIHDGQIWFEPIAEIITRHIDKLKVWDRYKIEQAA